MIFELKFEDIVLVNFISLKRVNTDGMRVVWVIIMVLCMGMGMGMGVGMVMTVWAWHGHGHGDGSLDWEC